MWGKDIGSFFKQNILTPMITVIFTALLSIVGTYLYNTISDKVDKKYSARIEGIEKDMDAEKKKLEILGDDIGKIALETEKNKARLEWHDGAKLKEMEAWARLFENMDKINVRLKALEHEQEKILKRQGITRTNDQWGQ